MDDHLARNRSEWNRWAPDWIERGRRSWSQPQITWGSLEAAESGLGLLGDVAGKRVLELGCGTAYFSSWLARRGAAVVGLDLSERQLERRRCFSSANSESPSRSFRRTRSRFLSLTGHSTWCSRSTGRASGPTLTVGSRKLVVYFGRAASSFSLSAAPSAISATRMKSLRP